MKKSRFSDSQILAILKQAESGTPVPEVCREGGKPGHTWKTIQAGAFDASWFRS